MSFECLIQNTLPNIIKKKKKKSVWVPFLGSAPMQSNCKAEKLQKPPGTTASGGTDFVHSALQDFDPKQLGHAMLCLLILSGTYKAVNALCHITLQPSRKTPG